MEAHVVYRLPAGHRPVVFRKSEPTTRSGPAVAQSPLRFPSNARRTRPVIGRARHESRHRPSGHALASGHIDGLICPADDRHTSSGARRPRTTTLPPATPAKTTTAASPPETVISERPRLVIRSWTPKGTSRSWSEKRCNRACNGPSSQQVRHQSWATAPLDRSAASAYRIERSRRTAIPFHRLVERRRLAGPVPHRKLRPAKRHCQIHHRQSERKTMSDEVELPPLVVKDRPRASSAFAANAAAWAGEYGGAVKSTGGTARLSGIAAVERHRPGHAAKAVRATSIRPASGRVHVALGETTEQLVRAHSDFNRQAR